MMTSDDKVGGWVKKGQNHDDVILECPLSANLILIKKSVQLLRGSFVTSYKIHALGRLHYHYLLAKTYI